MNIPTRRGRPAKVKKWLAAPSGPGAWWCRQSEDGPEARAMARRGSAETGERIEAAIVGHTKEFQPVAALVAAGWIAWRPRTLITQPPERWREFVAVAQKSIAAAGGYKLDKPPEEQLAAEIVRSGHAAAFLKAVRRGRATSRQNLRFQILREVERLAGDTVPRRREDRNTPEAVALRPARVLVLESEP